VIVFPFALRLVLAAAAGMDRSIEHAAVSLGASDAAVFRRVTLPLILPGVASGWLLAFITSFDEVTMTVFVATPATMTLPVRMFLYIQDNIDPLVTSVSAVVIVLTAIFMLLIEWLYGLERLFAGPGRHAEGPWTAQFTQPAWRGSAAGPPAPPGPGASRARARASSCSTKATWRSAPRAAISRWCGCRAKASACPSMPAGPSARRTCGAGSRANCRNRPASMWRS